MESADEVAEVQNVHKNKVGLLVAYKPTCDMVWRTKFGKVWQSSNSNVYMYDIDNSFCIYASRA